MLFEPASNRTIKELAALTRPSEARKQGVFLAEGFKVVSELLLSSLQLEMIVIRKGEDVGDLRFPHDLKVLECSVSDFDKISTLTTPAGILALVKRPSYDLPEAPRSGTWYLALDRINDPGNLGTMIRTAEWFGIRDVICEKGTADCYSSKVVQSAMGSLFRMRITYTDLPQFILNLNQNGGVKILAADASGTPVDDVDTAGGGVLIIGSESHGVSESLLKLAGLKIAIPRHPTSPTESLNAAVACGILLHEICSK
jgi:RNA methyltransferase, TrmH family